jgi:lipopolysaccharide/colanic/teichoic acid biosynthesis glycosyltransferase
MLLRNNLVSLSQKRLKRVFDFSLSILGLFFLWWAILIVWLLASIDTKKNGFFLQERIGKHSTRFKIIKIRTMLSSDFISTTVTSVDDSRTTNLGKLFRKFKIDELPQLINIFLGHMSFVGPRPDVPGFADCLRGDDQTILSVRPGITGPASIKYKDEELLLSKQNNPEEYNMKVVWPDKVKINKQYIEEYSFLKDLSYIWITIVGVNEK